MLVVALFLPSIFSPALSQTLDLKPPQQFVVGRHTFFDFGPPNNYYEVYVVKQAKGGSRVQRITFTPEVNKCFAPAKTEYVEKSVSFTVEDLLGGTNPCKIPEKDLKKERDRKKRGMVFSGANVAMQIECGGATHIIRADILDRDWFAANPRTPKNTSWTMKLLERLDQATGPTVMDKPAFAMADEPNSAVESPDPIVQREISSGSYDELFSGAPDKVSVVYKDSLIIPPKPSVSLASSTPLRPTNFALPVYPRLPQLAAHEGSVIVHLALDGQGDVSAVILYTGSKLFEGAVRDAVKDWKFPVDPDVKEVQISFEFKLNCEAHSR